TDFAAHRPTDTKSSSTHQYLRRTRSHFQRRSRGRSQTPAIRSGAQSREEHAAHRFQRWWHERSFPIKRSTALITSPDNSPPRLGVIMISRASSRNGKYTPNG